MSRIRFRTIAIAAVLAASPGLAQAGDVQLAESVVRRAPAAEPLNAPADSPSLRLEVALREDESVPSAADFAYQVLLIVVSAVVSALVWKALD